MRKILLLLLALLLVGASLVTAQGDQYVFGDPLPTAPELAPRGDYGVGVRTLEMVDSNRIDVLSATEEDPTPRYDRPLTLEVWYPAEIPRGASEYITYQDTLGRADQDNLRPFEFTGRALRNAEPDAAAAPYPLVIVSHGYPGSRLMMSYLTENLASKGYVVVSIAHTESTYSDVSAFASTLLNRSLDQWAVLNEIDARSAGTSFLSGLVDADNTAIVGYSMGAYGALNAIGAGYNGIAANFGVGENIDTLVRGNARYEELQDERIQAAVLFAPWGGHLGFAGMPDRAMWSEEALGDIEIPTFWLVGSRDDVAMYSGVERLFNWAVSSERHMLVYDNALHNVAPNPPPPEAEALGDWARFGDPVWDERRINNVNQHFVTAFLDWKLKGDRNAAGYLDVPVESSNEGVVALDDDGNPTEDHSYWPGFPPRTALGLRLVTGEME